MRGTWISAATAAAIMLDATGYAAAQQRQAGQDHPAPRPKRGRRIGIRPGYRQHGQKSRLVPTDSGRNRRGGPDRPPAARNRRPRRADRSRRDAARPLENAPIQQRSTDRRTAQGQAFPESRQGEAGCLVGLWATLPSFAVVGPPGVGKKPIYSPKSPGVGSKPSPCRASW